MSQYGAYGAAHRGLSWKQILDFYYPHTTRAQLKANARIWVWITADSDNDLKVMPSAGLSLRDTDGHSFELPTGSAYTAWRVRRSGSGFALSYRNDAGKWISTSAPLSATTWWFGDTARVVTVWLPGGARRELRGTMALVKRGSGGRTVNRLLVDDYVRGVVPSEMPTSWATDAIRAQAVAARSYAARLQVSRHSEGGYDVCDTTSCQVYRGYASTSSGHRRVFETERGNAAVDATSRTILKYGTSVVLTEFASSNGGSTVKTGLPYQVAKLDPYDDVMASNTWSRTVSGSSIARAWPTAGTVQQVQVTKRTGVGRWGGRVLTIKIVGSRRTVTVSGGSFESRFGLRSTLFTVSSEAS